MRIVWLISKLSGGGAEHVLFQLAEYMLKQGHKSEILITSQGAESANLYGTADDVQCFFLQIKDKKNTSVWFAVQAINKVYEKIFSKPSFALQKRSFKEMYKEEIAFIRQHLQSQDDTVAIAFLHPADQLTMVSVEGMNIPVVISERADPIRYFKKKYTQMFLKEYYPSVDAMVFQTPNAMRCYPTCIQEKGTVILNPIRESLPERFEGIRQKVIVNFCRLTAQKNLFLLLDAFEIFHKNHRDYKLVIYGKGEQETELHDYAASKALTDSFEILPHRDDIHEVIRDHAMFVSSSDYEGMSNSMLEAMAIGLPVVCTDCPIGGAAYVIQDHENGLLVPVGDAQKMAEAMAEIADDAELAEKLSKNAAELKKKMNIETIGQQWLQVINEAKNKL